VNTIIAIATLEYKLYRHEAIKFSISRCLDSIQKENFSEVFIVMALHPFKSLYEIFHCLTSKVRKTMKTFQHSERLS